MFTFFEINGQQFGLTTTHINTLIVMAILTVFGLVARSKVKKFTMVPETKFQLIIESLVDLFGGFTANTMGEKNKRFAYFYGPMFLFILVSNWSGMLGLRPPTADIATTFALSLTTFFMIHGFGIKANGLGYFKGFFEPIPLLFPLNVIGDRKSVV